jgi:pre-mRNA-splicing factor ATP-dependent RNA helicase DHX38/PRP16
MTHTRQRAEDTPSHPGGLSKEGREALEAHRRRRDHQRGEYASFRYSYFPFLSAAEGISALHEKKVDRPRGLDDFKRRSNRDRDRVKGRQEYPRGWEATPRSERGPRRDDAPSLRVPNLRWDATPRSQSDGSGGGWGRTGARAWDAPTPRASQDSSPDQGNAEELDVREWEEEQVRLDRDWYMGAEEGSLMGDEEHNPLAQYEDLTMIKQVEIAKRPVVSPLFVARPRAWLTAIMRKYLQNKHNM